MSSMMKIGANVHRWANAWHDNLALIAGVPQNRGIARFDESTQTDPHALIAHVDEVLSYGLYPLCVLVVAPADRSEHVFADYLQRLVPLAGSREFIVEFDNEPNYRGWGPAQYRQAVINGWNASGPIHVSLGGMAMNDQHYLSMLGPDIDEYVDFVQMHLYTAGGALNTTDPGWVGPLLPCDRDDAHNGWYSFVRGIDDTQARYPGKPLIIGEWGWSARYLQDWAGRPVWNQAAIAIARQRNVWGMCIEELGSGDGPDSDQIGASWDACVQAASV